MEVMWNRRWECLPMWVKGLYITTVWTARLFEEVDVRGDAGDLDYGGEEDFEHAWSEQEPLHSDYSDDCDSRGGVPR